VKYFVLLVSAAASLAISCASAPATQPVDTSVEKSGAAGSDSGTAGGKTGGNTAAGDDEAMPGDYAAPKAVGAMVMNGKGDEASWTKVPWAPIDQLWLGEPVTPQDFSGRYKIVWNEDRLYYLIEITDDVYQDTHSDPR
jgi:hypothetical protein